MILRGHLTAAFLPAFITQSKPTTVEDGLIWKKQWWWKWWYRWYSRQAISLDIKHGWRVVKKNWNHPDHHTLFCIIDTGIDTSEHVHAWRKVWHFLGTNLNFYGGTKWCCIFRLAGLGYAVAGFHCLLERLLWCLSEIAAVFINIWRYWRPPNESREEERATNYRFKLVLQIKKFTGVVTENKQCMALDLTIYSSLNECNPQHLLRHSVPLSQLWLSRFHRTLGFWYTKQDVLMLWALH